MSNGAQKILIGLTVLAVFAVAMWGSINEQRAWEDYARTNHCHSVGTKQGQFVYSKHGGWTSDQTIYACDGGEIQIR